MKLKITTNDSRKQLVRDKQQQIIQFQNALIPSNILSYSIRKSNENKLIIYIMSLITNLFQLHSSHNISYRTLLYYNIIVIEINY